MNHLLDSVLRKTGYRVSHAYAGAEALLFPYILFSKGIPAF